jgi:hypothetical protein
MIKSLNKLKKKKKKKKKKRRALPWGLMPVILATQEAEIRREDCGLKPAWANSS